MYWVLMICLFLITGMIWHFQIEFHVPGFCPFTKSKFVNIFLEHSYVCIRLKSYLHNGVISNCGSNFVWNVVNVKMNRQKQNTGPCGNPYRNFRGGLAL